MTNKLEAISEAFKNHKRWMDGAIVVDCGNDEFQAIPGMYLSDVSYTGSRKIVHDLRYEISDSEWLRFQAYLGKDAPSTYSEAIENNADEYAQFILGQ